MILQSILFIINIFEIEWTKTSFFSDFLYNFRPFRSTADLLSVDVSLRSFIGFKGSESFSRLFILMLEKLNLFHLTVLTPLVLISR